MNKIDLRYRQIHLDFHTSPEIEGVGEEFDAEEFAATLEKANVDSITCFARCHHGMLYYDSKLFPERVHPHLINKNLLRDIITACHKRDIRVPIYTTVQWDYFTAEEHPEWIAIDKNGRQKGTPPYEAGFYRVLCVNSPYRDFLKDTVKEILEVLPTDGLFFDIVYPTDCSCKYCQAKMNAQGIEISDDAARIRYAVQMIDEFKLEMSKFIYQINEVTAVFYNTSHIGTLQRAAVGAYSHFELESLPSGGWGYLHFPMTIRYARNLGLDCVGVTGKFHTNWGDFHSFKNKAALEYECYRMLALNAKCMIGDQMEPEGKLSGVVYKLIGSVYSHVKEKELWCSGAKAIVDIGVMTPEEFYGQPDGALPASMMGINRMLEEGGHQFDVIDSKSNFSKYKVLILPDTIPVDDALNSKLEIFIGNGGAVIASFESGLDRDQKEFNFKLAGVKMKSQMTLTSDGKPARGLNFPSNNYVDYLLPVGGIGKGLPETEHVMYMRGLEIEAERGTEILANKILSYFDRTYKHFCSHRQTPASRKTGDPGIVKKGNVIYFSNPIFIQYNQNAPRWCKQLFLNALDMLLPEPLLRHNGPSTVLATVNEQERENRWVIHLLHYIPERRCKEIDVIEDIIPLYNIKISVNIQRNTSGIRLVPEQKILGFEIKDGRAEFIVPEIKGHQMIEISF
jgi:hypothetical protein